MICLHTKDCPYYAEYDKRRKDSAADRSWNPDDSLPTDVLHPPRTERPGYICKAWVYADSVARGNDFKRAPSECDPLKTLNLLLEINERLNSIGGQT